MFFLKRKANKKNDSKSNSENLTSDLGADTKKQLKEDLIENSEAYFQVWWDEVQFIKYTQNVLNNYNVRISDTEIYNTFLELYRLSIGVYDLAEFDRILSRERLNIVKKYLQFSPEAISGYSLTGDQMFEDENIGIKYNEIAFIEGLEYKKGDLQSTIDIKKKARLSPKNVLVCYMIGSIESLVITMIIYRNRNKLLNHNEFYSLMKNVFSEFGYSEAISKVHTMYSNFYSDLLGPDWTYQNIQLLLEMMYDLIKWGSSAGNNQDIKDDTTLYNDIYMSTCQAVEDRTDVDEVTIKFFYLTILGDKVSTSSIDSTFNNLLKVTDINTDVDRYLKLKRLEEEKNRYIIGDFENERAIERESLKLLNVTNGIEFEEYLGGLFCKLGYNVTLTQTTGDQGADLIINKEGVKTVVQAKYYTSKVSNKAVQEVVSAIKYYGADNGMVVTNNFYTQSAIELAEVNNVNLINGDTLEGIIRNITNEQVCNDLEAENDEFSEENFLSRRFSVGNCFFNNTNVGEYEYDYVELELSNGHLLIESLETDKSRYKLEIVIDPIEFKMLLIGEDDSILVSIGCERFSMNKTQCELVEAYVKLLKSLND